MESTQCYLKLGNSFINVHNIVCCCLLGIGETHHRFDGPVRNYERVYGHVGYEVHRSQARVEEASVRTPSGKAKTDDDGNGC